jgi:hypothetical protein
MRRQSLFSSAKKSKKENKENLTKQDCQRIKTNHGYFLKTHCHLPVKEMYDAAPSIINHHFNDHSGCEKWCPYSLSVPEEERKELSEEEAKKRYRSKIVHLPLSPGNVWRRVRIHSTVRRMKPSTSPSPRLHPNTRTIQKPRP